MSTLSLTMQTLCQRCYYYVDTIVYLVIDYADTLYGLGAGVVIDYAIPWSVISLNIKTCDERKVWTQRTNSV